MVTFTSEQQQAGSSPAPRDRISCGQWAVLTCIIGVSLNLAHAAGFDDTGALSNLRASSSTSVVVNESRPKNLAVSGTSNATVGVRAATLPDDRDLSICNEKTQPLCRDLAASEFQVTSLRFMLPEVRGLSPKSLNIRRNSVSATYTFR